MVYLQQEKELSYKTIKVYTAAVRFWIVTNGGPDPVRTAGGAMDPIYRILLEVFNTLQSEKRGHLVNH